MSGRSSLLTILFLLTACARPNYQDAQSNPNNGELSDPARGEAPADDCRLFFDKSNLCVDLQWEKLPTTSEKGSFVLRFYEKQNNAILLDPTLSVAVTLWMPSMGHGSSPVKIERQAQGVYRISNVFFIMPGEWDIRIQLKNEGQIIEQIIKPYFL